MTYAEYQRNSPLKHCVTLREYAEAMTDLDNDICWHQFYLGRFLTEQEFHELWVKHHKADEAAPDR